MSIPRVVARYQAGRAAGTWEPVAVTATDATGNASEPLVLSTERRQGELRLYFGGALWPGEPAWKLRAEFSRVAGFASAQAFSDGAAPCCASTWYETVLHRAGEPARGDAGLALYRTAARLPAPAHAALAALQRARRGAGFTRSGRAATSLFRATTADGHEIPARFVDGYNGHYGFGLEVPQGVKSVDLTFAIPRSRFVEFVVKPIPR